MLNVIAQLGDVAEGQRGSITHSQASALDISAGTIRDLIEARIVEPVIDGVFRMRGGGRHPFPRLFAEWLLLEPIRYAWQRSLPETGVVSHRAALRVYNLGDWPGPTAEFTVSPTSPPPRAGGPPLHRHVLRSDEWQMVSDLPVTTPSRTIVDIAVSSTDSRDLSRLVDSVLRRGLASAESLSDALASCALDGEGGQLLAALVAPHEADL